MKRKIHENNPLPEYISNQPIRHKQDVTQGQFFKLNKAGLN